MKKFLLSIVTLALVAFGLNTLALAAQQYSSGYFYYHSYDGYVSICGYFGDETTVEIPSTIATRPVSIIESGAFDGCDTVVQIILPDTIMEVQSGAFSGAANLVSVIDYQGKEILGTASGTDTASTEAPAADDATEAAAAEDTTAAEDAAGTETEAIAQYDYIESEDEVTSAQENEKNREQIDQALSGTTQESAGAQTEGASDTRGTDAAGGTATTETASADSAQTAETDTQDAFPVVTVAVLAAGLVVAAAALWHYIAGRKKNRR